MVRLKLINGKNSKLLNLNLFLMTLLLLVPLLSGCSVSSTTPEPEIETEIPNFEEKITEINDLNEVKNNEVLIKDYEKNITELNRELEMERKNIELYINEINEFYKRNNFTWSGCSEIKNVTTFCKKGCDFELVCSESMRNTFSCENTLYFCFAEKDEIRKGDVIAFLTPEFTNDNFETFYTIHRVINITSDGFVTKGDNVLYPDKIITSYENVLGKLWRIDG